MTAEHPFRRQLAEELPALRAFARSLGRDAAHADDLTQEALLKAWAKRDSFREGTNLRAWLFTILRNGFYSEHRKRRREAPDPDEAHASRLAERPPQDHALALEDFRVAFSRLPPDQREALALVGAAGLSYDAAAAVCGVAAGTVKSRVSRGRTALGAALGVDGGADLVADQTMDAALGGAITSVV
jgi:RNA polymerase sigma-70 factor (ECF subfamily)